MSRCAAARRGTQGVAVPETPSAKDREGHELTHLPTQPWCSICVQAKRVDERHLRRHAGERAQDQRVDHLAVIQFDCAHLSSVTAKGQQVRMHNSGYQHGIWHSVCD